ncbi:hypothetical protein [Salinibacillus xinjiangensis]|uniref:Uncharacterized protein n=1 Tax=Salinibacillus xinjiangensis TaxID=1229268 RepID=A0A6G1X534_9BACI|nr:hypothetical protein [Salinibacillus xinjiangensis]MRG86113.1 hypothetical protein [Salinibacillus xinjiangensis]
MIMYVTYIITIIPLILYVWSAINVGAGKSDKINWKRSLYAFLFIFLVSIVVNTYLKVKFDYDLFLNGYDLTVIAVVLGIFCLIFALIYTFTYRKLKHAPKSVFDPAGVSKILGMLLATIAVGFFWFHPIGEKILLIQSYSNAEEVFAEEEEKKEFSLALVYSEDICINTRTTRCSMDDYKNIVMAKNNLNETYEVQFKMRVLNMNDEELKVIDSNIMTLKPGEIKQVKTSETIEASSEWSQYSFQTEDQVHSYQYTFRYRKP